MTTLGQTNALQCYHWVCLKEKEVWTWLMLSTENVQESCLMKSKFLCPSRLFLALYTDNQSLVPNRGNFEMFTLQSVTFSGFHCFHFQFVLFFGHFHSSPPLCNPSLRPVGLGAYGPFAAPQTYVTDLLGVVIIYMIIIIISCHNLWNQLWGWKVENFSYVTFIKNSLLWLLAIGWA